MSNLFQKLGYEAFRAGVTPRTKESMTWFRQKARTIRRVNRREIMKEDPIQLRNTFRPGNMFMFFYDPKTKETLPYYDKFPLVIVVGKAEGGFYGLNLHYISPLLRVKLLDALMANTTDRRYDENTRFKLNYAMLNRSSKLRFYKPCFKHYLLDHVQSRLAHVPAPEWEIATFLPMANWQGARGAAVYKFSKEMI
tara:strand:- start:3125 stop:3709 length:585 start_codon:yes stop_codon:yes gene_type:complete